VDQLSQALELTSSDETSLESKDIDGVEPLVTQRYKQVMSPRIDIFALEITESFADIYSKLSKRIFQNSSLSG
jgi:CBS domain containing-hemolysin-like protein